jgi:arsenate reductase-like glutaredoxin family protein
MGEVKSAFEKAMEKVRDVEDLTPEEKKKFREQEKIKAVLGELFRGELTRDGIWERLKTTRPSLLKEAQMNIVDSLRLGSLPEEFNLRKDGILAIEVLKESPDPAKVEDLLNTIGKIQKQYNDGIEQAVRELRTAIEENPQMRMRPVQTPDGRVVHASLTVEEAMQERLSEFLAQHEKQFERLFSQTVSKLKEELK